MGKSITTKQSTLQMVESNDLQTKIQAMIDDNKVMVFSKSYCPFAKQTKDLFKAKSIDAKIYELDQEADGADIQNKLKEMSGQSTVPNVYINGKTSEETLMSKHLRKLEISIPLLMLDGGSTTCARSHR